jgi:hypothetical protein
MPSMAIAALRRPGASQGCPRPPAGFLPALHVTLTRNGDGCNAIHGYQERARPTTRRPLTIVRGFYDVDLTWTQ